MMRNLILCGVIALTSLNVGSLCAEPSPTMRMWLKNGSYLEGQIVVGDQPGTIGFKSPMFRKPILFDVAGIRSIAGETQSNDQLSGHFFLIDGGTRISGDLVDWVDDRVIIQSPSLGKISLHRDKLRLIEAAEDGGKRVYSGPRSLDDWTILDNVTNWEFAAGSLSALSKHARAAGDVKLPEKFRLNLSMAWEGRADFVLSLGCDRPKKPVAAPNNNRRVAVANASPGAAVRLEMWDAQLAVVREIGNLADIAVLPLDDDAARFELTIYVDQKAGLVAVYSMRGRLLEKIQVAEEKGSVREFALLENHGRKVSLEKFDVYSWDGHLPNSTEYPESYVLDVNEEVILGSIAGFNSDSKSLKVVDKDGEEKELELASLRRAVIAPDTTEGKSDDDDLEEAESSDKDAEEDDVDGPDEAEPAAEPESDPLAELRTIELEFSDSSRLVGLVQETRDGRFVFSGKGIDGDVSCPPKSVVAVIGSESSDGFEPPELDGVGGTLENETTKLYGAMVDQPNPEGDAVLHWQPWGGTGAVPLSQTASGTIRYSRVGQMKKKPVAKNEAVKKEPSAIGVLLGGIFGDEKNGQPPKQAAAAKNTKIAAYEIVFRSGDAVNGAIERINQDGVFFTSEETDTKFVPHAKIDSVKLSRMNTRHKFDSEKMLRLMTVPRSMKNDPPTHLFIATTGDYLRGRLVGVDEENVQVEVRLAVKDVPRKMIGRIIWLHDRPWLEEKENAEEDAGDEPDAGDESDTLEDPETDQAGRFMVHAVHPNRRGVTFRPTKVQDGRLIGESELLGQCSIDLGSITSLLFGTDVGKKALALRKESWTLALAKMPKAWEQSDDPSTLGVESELVGRQAPGIRLKTIDGQPFDLQELRGKVVVLDFWASWCGPCIQTMPEVDRIVEEFDKQDVELVAVNLQDSVTRAELAVERMGIKATVVMDVDGETGRYYDARAIPQTVIVDRDGKIKHLFVGGGQKFLEQFATALKAVITEEAATE